MNKLYADVLSHNSYGLNELSVKNDPHDVRESGDVTSESGKHGLNVLNCLGTELSLNVLNGLNCLGPQLA